MIGWRPWLIGVPPAVFGLVLVADLIGFPMRELGAVLILTLAPGAAVLWLIGVRERAAWLALVVPVSLSVDLIVGTTLVYFGMWSVGLAFAIVCMITVAMVALVPFERGARVALIVLALLPGILLVAAELAPEAAALDVQQRRGAGDLS